MKSALLLLSMFFIGTFLIPVQTFAANDDALASSDPRIVVTSVDSNRINVLQYNFSTNVELYFETNMPRSASYKLGKIDHESAEQSFKLPSAIKKSVSGTIVARDKAGNSLAQSEAVTVGVFASDAPACDIRSSKNIVSPGEEFEIIWNSRHAKSVYKGVGFETGSQKALKKKGDMTLSSSIPGIRLYSLVFGSESGSQSNCTVFVDVVSTADDTDEDKIAINAFSLDTKSLRPTLTGTARDVETIRVSVSSLNEKAGGFYWVSKPTKVKDGKWSVRVGKLPKRNTEYSVEVHEYDNGQYGVSEKSTLIVR